MALRRYMVKSVYLGLYRTFIASSLTKALVEDSLFYSVGVVSMGLSQPSFPNELI
jgi:hypothetical protein